MTSISCIFPDDDEDVADILEDDEDDDGKCFDINGTFKREFSSPCR